ncbi:hypothetical protein GGQ60_001313 [Pedobacter zeae]|uniref:Uncharacterized protein n=1 Tax=Pedobacter zeae TaxID=1737356 RepID=A0A7W6K8V9_9SPHI|nr:hypothetical protein [Pedobacter zeae]
MVLNKQPPCWAANLAIKPIIANQNQKKANNAFISCMSINNRVIVLILVLNAAKIYPKTDHLFDYFLALLIF